MSIDNRSQLAYFTVMSRETAQCRRCIDELNNLNEEIINPEVMKRVRECKEYLETEIRSLYAKVRERQQELLGPDPLEDKLRSYFEEEEE